MPKSKVRLPWVIVPLYLLNLLFIWTSRLIDYGPLQFLGALWVPLETILKLVSLGIFHQNTAYPEVDSLAVICLALSFLGLRGYLGWKRAALLMSINLAVFEAELFTFDYEEFWIPVFYSQYGHWFAVWFTNADLLITASAATVALFVWTYWPDWIPKRRH